MKGQMYQTVFQMSNSCFVKLFRMVRQQNVLYFAYGSCMDITKIKDFRDMVGRGMVFECNLQFTLHAAVADEQT